MRMQPRAAHARIRAAALLAVTLAACNGTLPGQRAPAPAPAVSPVSANAAVIADYLQMLQRLIAGPPTQQAEILASAEHDYAVAPTPSHELRLALILGTHGHPGTNLTRAQGLLRELNANPEMLLPAERQLAALELSQVDDHLTLEAENRRLQADATRADHALVANANKRLQAELDENARLRKELDAARAKLDAITNIERSLNERKPSTTGR
jgi:YfhG lipoprotein